VRHLRERPDQVVKFAWFGMFPFALAGVLLGSGPLIAACGLVISLVGLVLVTDHHRVLERISERYRDSWAFRLQGKTRVTRFEGALCLVIGLGWLVLGLSLTLP
jgi:hypothetical protein